MATLTTTQERKSSRPRKVVERYGTQSGIKRKRGDEDGDDTEGLEDEGLDESEELDEPEDDVNEDEGEEYVAPRVSAKATQPRTSKRPKTAGESHNTQQASKPKGKVRAKKTDGPPRQPAKAKAKAPAQPQSDGALDEEGMIGGVKSDNHLFNALLSPSTSFQTVTEDFLDALRESPLPALAELITMVVRCCGASADVTTDEVGDEDGIVSVCEDMMDAVKKAQAPPYPLISKLPAFKILRKSLHTFLGLLLTSSHSTSQLYESDLVSTLLAWLTTMSSSGLRSFRHTSTYVAACVVNGLCDVGASLEKELGVLGRQRETERKKKGKLTAKDPIEKRWAQSRERKKQVEEFLTEFFDGVFVHRYRDFDPEIRAECIRELGSWMKAHPAHFLDGQYLRYVGWVLSDTNTHVRLEALKALTPLYSLSTSTSTSLHHFTSRFLERLVQIALSDTDVPVRCASITVLTEIDAHGLWGDDDNADGAEREKICLLVWDPETRVRKAVSAFFAGIWKERVDEVMESHGKKVASGDKERVGVKQLATLLARLESLADEDNESGSDDPHAAYIARQVSTRLSTTPSGPQSRVSLAVETLWSHVEAIREWEGLLELLLLDHSIGDDTASPRKRKARAKKNETTEEEAELPEQVDERWRLDEREEGILLEVFVAALSKAIAEAEAGKKTDADEVRAEITRSVISALPKLFAKHQTDAGRVADVLMIPRLLELDLYVEMRETKAYEQLWDDLTQQFLRHSEPLVLRHSIGTLMHLLSAGASLANINTHKVTELEDELFSSLRDAVAGRDELELANFTDDEVHALGAVASRIACLFAHRDLTIAMEEDEGGKQSSAWDIVCALAERGRLGYKEEETMVDQCLKALKLHIVWKTRTLIADETITPNDEDARKALLLEQRGVLLEKLTEFAVGTQSNVCESVRRASFDALLNLYVLYTSYETPGPARTAGLLFPLTLDDELQYRCAGFMQAEIERYATEFEEVTTKADEDNDDGEGSGQDDDDAAAEKKKDKNLVRKAKEHQEVKLSKARLEREYLFCSGLTAFISAINVGVLHIRHSAVVLAHYGRFGPTVDLCMKALVDILRDEGIQGKNGGPVALAISKSLEDAFELYLDSMVPTDAHCMAVARVLCGAFVIRSGHFAILKRLPSRYVIEVHRDVINWLVPRLQTASAATNKKKRNKLIGLWKALVPLLGTVEPRDALEIKRHLDSALKESKLDISESSKLWEPLRSFEKRLVNIMAKDKAIGEAAKAATRRVATAPALVDEVQEINDLETPTRPKPRPRPRPVPKEPIPSQQGDQVSPRQAQPEALAFSPVGVNGISTPLANGSRIGNGTKRPRTEEEEDDDLSLDLDLDGSADEEEQDALKALIERGKNSADAAPPSQMEEIGGRVKRRRR